MSKLLQTVHNVIWPPKMRKWEFMYQEKASFTLRPAIENEIKLKYLPGFLFNAMSCRCLTAKCKD